MKRICPNPMQWHEAIECLTSYAQRNSCTPASPPKPLILAGWAYSNDIQKMQRWEETVDWAEKNGCSNLVSGIPDQDFYFVENPTSYTVGPMGGPMYRAWDFNSKDRPSYKVLQKGMGILITQWSEIAGEELSRITIPLAFTGNKARRLLIKADAASKPPWGGWDYLSHADAERRIFTRFRSSINDAISPHEVDHIDFITEEIAEPGAFSQRKKPHG